MPKIEEHQPASLGDLLRIVEEYQSGRKFVWYRGVTNADFALIPSIARSSSIKDEGDVDALEKEIYATFCQRSPPFVDRDLIGPWKNLFFMQHYGVPTRLLDWSESPFVSLYFALSGVKRTEDGHPTSDVALWLCDPVEWNRTALSHITFRGEILHEGSEQIKAYSPEIHIDHKATQPIMIYGVHNSARIVAQRGVFALFGKSMKGMEQVFTSTEFPKRSLEKIVIPKELIDTLLNSLYQKGFSESTIYPDLMGLSLEIRRKFGFQ